MEVIKLLFLSYWGCMEYVIHHFHNLCNFENNGFNEGGISL